MSDLPENQKVAMTIVDGRLIAGQNPAQSTSAAQVLVNLLDRNAAA